MLKRLFTVFISVIIGLCCLSGCSYKAYKDYYYEDSYNEIWELTGICRIQKENASLFPQDISNLKPEKFYCRYDQQLPLGEGVQVYLEVIYPSKEDYKAETERISSVATDCSEYFENSELTAYSIYLDEDYFEYALFDDTQNKIYYIYLQYLPEKEIEFDHKFLPDNYKDYESNKFGGIRLMQQ